MATFLVVSSGSHGTSGHDGSCGSSGQDGSDGGHGESGASARPVTVTLGFVDDDRGGKALIGETSSGQMVTSSVGSSQLGDSKIGIAAKGGDGGHGGECVHRMVFTSDTCSSAQHSYAHPTLHSQRVKAVAEEAGMVGLGEMAAMQQDIPAQQTAVSNAGRIHVFDGLCST